MVHAELNILVDFACNLGTTTRLAKTLKDSGFSPRILTYDTLRLRERLRLADKPEEAILKLNTILDKAKNTHHLWSTLCIEVWTEISQACSVEPTLIAYEDLCIYARKGAGRKLVLKVTWLTPCKHMVGTLVPESFTRFCTTDPSTLDTVKQVVSKLVEQLPKLCEEILNTGRRR